MLRARIVMVVGLLFAVAGTSPAPAQDSDWGGFVGFGGSFPASDSRGSFKDGWSFTGGVARNFSEKFALQADYSFNRYGLDNKQFAGTDLAGAHTLLNIFLNAVVFTNSVDRSSLYLVAGGGATHRNVEVTRFAGYAGGIVCNPWWFVRSPGVVPVEQVLGSRSTWDPGVNVGLGLQVSLGGGSAKFFVESRYQYIRASRRQGGGSVRSGVIQLSRPQEHPVEDPEKERRRC